MSVEFKATHKELILKALEQARYQYRDQGRYIKIGYGAEAMTLDLEQQTAEVPVGRQDQLNQLKQAYSEQVLEEVARKRKWLLKKQAQRKYQLKRA